MPPSGVRLVSSSSSPVMVPTSSVITPPVVETKVERKDRLVSAPPTSGGPTRCEHLSERRFLGVLYAKVPVGLDPDPPPGVLAPVVLVRRFPRLWPLVPLRTIRPCVGAQEHFRIVGVRLAVCGAPRIRTSPGAPGVCQRNHMVDIDLGRIAQRPSRVRVEPRPGRHGAVVVDLDALAVPDQRGVPNITGAVGLLPTEARRVRSPVRELVSGVSHHAPRRGNREPP